MHKSGLCRRAVSVRLTVCPSVINSHLFTSDKGGGKCFCGYCRFDACVRLSVCLLARLLKNACVDLDEMLRVDSCRTWTN